MKSLFDSPPKPQNTSEPEKVESKETVADSSSGVAFADLLKVKPKENPHTSTFGVVFANDLAKTEIEKEKPAFPAGSIIVREKNLSADSLTPETVIAMVKREKGFSKETGDWEFFVFDGADLKLQKRETKGDCAGCHIRAKESDWVFRFN